MCDVRQAPEIAAIVDLRVARIRERRLGGAHAAGAECFVNPLTRTSVDCI
jgi:hypothetical protein